MSGTTQVSQHQKGKTRKVKPIWIYWSKRYWLTKRSKRSAIITAGCSVHSEEW